MPFLTKVGGKARGGIGSQLAGQPQAVQALAASGVVLEPGEELHAFSQRKPFRVLGLACILVGGYSALNILLAYYSAALIPVVIGGAVLVWFGVWQAFLACRQYVFATNRRVIHTKTDILGRTNGKPLLAAITDLEAVKAMRRWAMFTAKSGVGDLILKKHDGKIVLLPTLYQGDLVAQAIKRGIDGY